MTNHSAARSPWQYFVGLLLLVGLTQTPSALARNRPPSNPWPYDLFAFTDITSKTIAPDALGPAPPFNRADYLPYEKPGSATIRGNVSIQTTHGVAHCGLAFTYLVPTTQWTTWLMEDVATVARRTENPRSADLFLASLPAWMHPGYDRDDDARESHGIVRQAGCSSGGDFSFDHVPPGQYLIVIANTVLYTGQADFTDTIRTENYGSIVYTHYHYKENVPVSADVLWLGVRQSLLIKPEAGVVDLPGDWLGVYAHMHAFSSYPNGPPSVTLTS